MSAESDQMEEIDIFGNTEVNLYPYSWYRLDIDS